MKPQKNYYLGAWGLGNTFGPLARPKDVSGHKSKTLAPIFATITSFSQES